MNTPLTDKQQYWSDKLQLAGQSGYTLAEYARLNDIPAQKLYQWRSTVKKQETTTQICKRQSIHTFRRPVKSVIINSSITGAINEHLTYQQTAVLVR